MTVPRPLGLGEAMVRPGSHLLGFFSDPQHLDMPALRYLEAAAGEHLHALPVIAACLYPRTAMSAEALRRLRRGHDVLVRVEHGSIMLLETHPAHD